MVRVQMLDIVLQVHVHEFSYEILFEDVDVVSQLWLKGYDKISIKYLDTLFPTTCL